MDGIAVPAVSERHVEQSFGSDDGVRNRKRESRYKRFRRIPVGKFMDLFCRALLTDRRLHAVGAVGLAVCLTTRVAGAELRAVESPATQVSVEVSPLRVELKTEPGGATTQAITIHNTGADAVRVRATVSDWHLSMEGAPQFAAAEDARYSASGWTRLAPPEQVIEVGREAIVRFTLAVPADTTAAGYRTSVLFEFGPASGAPVGRGHDVVVRSRIATLIYVNVGNAPAAVDLSNLTSRALPNQPPRVVAVLKNTGRPHRAGARHDDDLQQRRRQSR